MPELPEVETIMRALRDGLPRKSASPDRVAKTRETYQAASSHSIIGKTIRKAELLWHRTLAEPDEPQFYSRMIGQTITGMNRRAKYLLIHLETDHLVIHLRMSGDLLLEHPRDPLLPHHRLVLYLDDDLRLAFNDTRKFGRVWLLSDPTTLLSKLGPEPLDDTFTPGQFHQMLSSSNRQLKPLLLDQHFIAGLGNIYTDEALHIARLHPLTKANTVTGEGAYALWSAIRAVLSEGIRRNGASIDWVYRGGDFQNYFKVYGRADEPCFRCGTPIQRLVVGQRGTHICPNCQGVSPT